VGAPRATHGRRPARPCAEDLARAAAEGSEPDAAMVLIHAPAALLDDLSDDERDAAGAVTPAS